MTRRFRFFRRSHAPSSVVRISPLIATAPISATRPLASVAFAVTTMDAIDVSRSTISTETPLIFVILSVAVLLVGVER